MLVLPFSSCWPLALVGPCCSVWQAVTHKEWEGHQSHLLVHLVLVALLYLVLAFTPDSLHLGMSRCGDST